ncbi:MAG: hypothetical protein A3J83_02140 [Elusimicrobia bacterium RIFOXYA2_FULL_40_6]|nr:MAG: hypothetical protein A3J83_02140 [Elusimicrobia bacterium RIFOXYA2_FULL_40_6]
MEILDVRRLKLLGMFWSRMKTFFFLLRTGKIKNALVYLWVSMFTRDAGLAIMDWFYRLNPHLAPYPEAIEVEVTTRCHLKCIICEHTYWNEPPRDMSFDEFKKVVDQFPKLKWIGLSGIGSSFINKDFIKMLQYLKSRHIFIEFYDTFDLIDSETSEELVKLGIDKIWMSCDGATKETYEKIRIGTKFEKVIGNVKGLIEAKKKYKTKIPELWFHYIVNKHNVSEMPQFVDLVHSIVSESKTNYATLIYFTSLLYFDKVLDLIPTIPKEIREQVVEKTKKYNIYLNWNENITCDKPAKDCTKWTEPFVLASGHIQPCCAINEANDRQFQKDYSFGNLFTEDFRTLWRADKLNKFKNAIHKGGIPRICKNCRLYKIK